MYCRCTDHYDTIEDTEVLNQINVRSNLLISVERTVLNSVPPELKSTVSPISNKYLVIKIYQDFSKVGFFQLKILTRFDSLDNSVQLDKNTNIL